MEVVVPRRQNQPSRRARLEIRWDEVEITPPTGALNQTWPNLKMRAVMAREVAAPGSAEPIEWVLLTNWPVTSAKMARRVVKWYGLRWGIECWHRVLKVGFGVEKRQLRTARALTRSLALDMIVAFRALLMTRLGRDHPDLPASVVYTDQEVQMIEILKKTPDNPAGRASRRGGRPQDDRERQAVRGRRRGQKLRGSPGRSRQEVSDTDHPPSQSNPGPPGRGLVQARRRPSRSPNHRRGPPALASVDPIRAALDIGAPEPERASQRFHVGGPGS